MVDWLKLLISSVGPEKRSKEDQAKIKKAEKLQEDKEVLAKI